MKMPRRLATLIEGYIWLITGILMAGIWYRVGGGGLYLLGLVGSVIFCSYEVRRTYKKMPTCAWKDCVSKADPATYGSGPFDEYLCSYHDEIQKGDPPYSGKF